MESFPPNFTYAALHAKAINMEPMMLARMRKDIYDITKDVLEVQGQRVRFRYPPEIPEVVIKIINKELKERFDEAFSYYPDQHSLIINLY